MSNPIQQNSMSQQADTTTDESCRFCTSKPGRRVMIEGKYGFAAYDRHPASEGHFLVIPYRHFADYFEIYDEEREELWEALTRLSGWDPPPDWPRPAV